ncbi:hypothetical protein ACFYW6_01355 [Streptomyces sp. NPDC002659]|uniref:hypothetical protein n=1 Tax=Streptomyces sp. NPDC002659 TaxID=3364656 RepID=UPI0036A23287
MAKGGFDTCLARDMIRRQILRERDIPGGAVQLRSPGAERAIMENPFRNGGPADKAMPYVSLIVSANLLAMGVMMYGEGASPLWPLAGGVLVLLACHEIYRQIRSRRDRA